jgi:DNA-binding PucR family transcriptional regulator
MAATQYAPIDPVERDIASAQLNELALVHDGQPWSRWKNAVVEWHVRALAAIRTQAWIPGLSTPQDPVVEEALGRYYRYHVRAAIGRLRDENVELRRKLIDALECARFYAQGGEDHGERAHLVLHDLPGSGSSHHTPDIEAKPTARSH